MCRDKRNGDLLKSNESNFFHDSVVCVWGACRVWRPSKWIRSWTIKDISIRLHLNCNDLPYNMGNQKKEMESAWIQARTQNYASRLHRFTTMKRSRVDGWQILAYVAQCSTSSFIACKSIPNLVDRHIQAHACGCMPFFVLIQRIRTHTQHTLTLVHTHSHQIQNRHFHWSVVGHLNFFCPT